MKRKKRLDQWIFEKGLAPSRTRAQELIHRGSVEVLTTTLKDGTENWERIYSPSEKFDCSAPPLFRINEKDPLTKYVSRGGLKLKGAMDYLKLHDLSLWQVLDVGQSTGGFTDCLLQSGAKKVVGIDVGHGQLSQFIRNNPKVLVFEGFHICDWHSHPSFKNNVPTPNGFDLIVVDVSFISLTLVLPFLVPLGQRILALVKPQFEVGAEKLTKKGIVKSDKFYPIVESKIRSQLNLLGWTVEDYFSSSISGKDGNLEFFVYASPKNTD